MYKREEGVLKQTRTGLSLHTVDRSCTGLL